MGRDRKGIRRAGRKCVPKNTTVIDIQKDGLI
jgi:hypothetical protein